MAEGFASLGPGVGEVAAAMGASAVYACIPGRLFVFTASGRIGTHSADFYPVGTVEDSGLYKNLRRMIAS